MIHWMRCKELVNAMLKETEAALAMSTENQQCKRKAVGCSIVAIDSNGSMELICREQNGPSAPGHFCSGEVGKCGCAHAEPRAIMRALRVGWGSMAYKRRLALLCSYSPCSNCANVINDSKIIKSVAFSVATEHDLRGIELLKNAGIDVHSLGVLLVSPDLCTCWDMP